MSRDRGRIEINLIFFFRLFKDLESGVTIESNATEFGVSLEKIVVHNCLPSLYPMVGIVFIVLYCIVFIRLYSTSHNMNLSEALVETSEGVRLGRSLKVFPNWTG